MRVVLVGKGPPERGGIPAVLTDLLEGPLADRHTLELCNLTRPDSVPQGGRLTAANLRRTAEDVARVARAARGAEVVHLHTALAPTVTLLRAGALAAAARRAGAAVVVHVHGGRVERWLEGAPRRRLVRGTLAAADVVVAASRAVAERLRGAGVGPVRVVRNGVDTTRFRPGGLAADPPQVLYVGGLTPRKGLVELVAASRRLRARGVHHELVLVGGTPDEGPEAEAAVRRVAEGYATLTGPLPRETLPERYRAAAVCCLPSWWEAAPMSVLEAMACGVPVVASAVGDVPELVGDAGRVVPPRDVDALEAALGWLLADPVRRRRLGVRARQQAERYSLTRTAEELDAVYAEAVRRRRQR